MFYMEGICLDFFYKGLRELIELSEIEKVCEIVGLEIKEGDMVLLYMNYYWENFNKENWKNGFGILIVVVRWLGEKKIVVFGVEMMLLGVFGIFNWEVYYICGELNFMYYENMINLYLLIGRGRFRFIGLFLKIRGGIGLLVRVVVIFEI